MKRILVHFRAILNLTLMSLSTIFWCTLLFFFAVFKFLLPFSAPRKIISSVLNFIGECWTNFNSLALNWIAGIEMSANYIDDLSQNESYLVFANHNSHADILIIQKLLNGRIPFLKFFLKQELIWYPVLGLAWWALDFPFMKRYSRQYLRKHPEKAGKDLESTRRSCEKFRNSDVSIMNFPEGTRFNSKKQQRQNSPYRHLLKPKAGGAGYVLAILGEQIDQIIDLTIHYPGGVPSYWGFLGGQSKKIEVRINLVDIPDEIKGDYINNPACRSQLQKWLNSIWRDKDNWLEYKITHAGIND